MYLGSYKITSSAIASYRTVSCLGTVCWIENKVGSDKFPDFCLQSATMSGLASDSTDVAGELLQDLLSRLDESGAVEEVDFAFGE